MNLVNEVSVNSILDEITGGVAPSTAETKGGPATVDKYPERFGEKFDPLIHSVDYKGEPVLTKWGKYSKRRGKGSKKFKNNQIDETKDPIPESKEIKEDAEFQEKPKEGGPEGEKDPDPKIKEPSGYDPDSDTFIEGGSAEDGNLLMATMITQGFQLFNCNLLGEEFVFQTFKFGNNEFEESAMCLNSVKAVLDHYQVEGEIHPVLGLVGFGAMFYGSRLRHEKPRKKMFVIFERVQLGAKFLGMKFRRWREKREMKKAEKVKDDE